MAFIVIVIFQVSFCSINGVYGQAVSGKSQKPCSQSGIGGGGWAADNAYAPSLSDEPRRPDYSVSTNSNLFILSKPISHYTKEATDNCVQGMVIVKATFFANGRIGNIRVVKGLPFGLSNQAIEAAKLIKFVPAKRNGKNISVSRKLEYNFTIY